MKKLLTASNLFLNLIKNPSISSASYGVKFFFIFFFLLLLSNILFSQDTTKVTSPLEKQEGTFHSPRKAMLFSACLPGLGQAYNKKYWKIPIVYATMGTTVYFFSSNDKFYREYKQAYTNKTDSDSTTIDLYPYYSKEQIQELVTYYRRYRDLNIILTAFFYTLNIVDAYVDAQLTTFDVSDDLSLHVLPSMNISTANRKPSAGLTLSLTF